jgi:mRNA interferase RelE/StbE
MAKPLRGQTSAWRLRVGDYRAIYEIDDVDRTVIVTQIGNRKDVYRGL